MDLHLSARTTSSTSSQIRELLHLTERPGMLSLAGGLPPASRFPTEAVRAAFDRALVHTTATGTTALQYGPTEGLQVLREIVAERESATVEEVLITTGSQQALDLAARVLTDPGDAIAVEEPTYLGARQAFLAAGATLVEVPGDHDGIDVDALDDLDHDRSGVEAPLRAIYTVPNFHNPTGSVLSSDRRRRLVAGALRRGEIVIEDDPYAELRFDGDALPSLRRYGDNVVHIGSTSKILAPGLRIGWMVAPPPIIDAATRLKQSVDLHTSTTSQLIAAELLCDAAWLDQHVTGLRRHHEAQRDVLVEALDRELGDDVTFDPPRGGMFCWARRSDGTDTTALLDRAIAEGVAFVPGAAFGSSVAAHLRLSFATLEPDDLREAVRRLARAW